MLSPYALKHCCSSRCANVLNVDPICAVRGKLYGHWLRAMKKTVRTQRVLRLRAWAGVTHVRIVRCR